MTREIPLTRGKVALVDDADYERVMAAGPWQAAERGRSWYAQKRATLEDGSRRQVLLHKFLTGWEMTDHVNGNGLDNRRANLREATHGQNMKNCRRRIDNRSGYKGVSERDGRWRARIVVDGKIHNLGQYATPEEAARIYDEAAMRLHGEFARLNFEQAAA